MIVTKNMIEAGAAALWALTDDAVRHAFNPGREPFPFSGVSDPPLQERYRRMSEACLIAAQSPSPEAGRQAFEGSIDTDTPLQAAAREAGWALTTLVEISDWQRRDQLSDIIGRLAAALLNGDAPPPQADVEGALLPLQINMAVDGNAVTLAACPAGPFLFNGSLGFKTEYGAISGKDLGGGLIQWTMVGGPDAYCMGSGEAFWGGVTSREARAALLVNPVELYFADEAAPAATEGSADA